MEVARKLDEPDVTFWNRILLKDIDRSLKTLEHKGLVERASSLFLLILTEASLKNNVSLLPLQGTVPSFWVPTALSHCRHSKS